MPKRPRIGLDRLIDLAGRGAGGLKIGKGSKAVADPTNEALIAECEALRLQLRLQTEQTDHFKAEAERLGALATEAQDDRDEMDDVVSQLVAKVTYLQGEVERLLIEPDQPD
jgi:hypothetical protein